MTTQGQGCRLATEPTDTPVLSLGACWEGGGEEPRSEVTGRLGTDWLWGPSEKGVREKQSCGSLCWELLSPQGQQTFPASDSFMWTHLLNGALLSGPWPAPIPL